MSDGGKANGGFEVFGWGMGEEVCVFGELGENNKNVGGGDQDEKASGAWIWNEFEKDKVVESKGKN